MFATTRAVSGQRRSALTSQLREEFGVRLHNVHDRADFIQLLYDSPKWRKDLLGVPGQARALTQLPTSRRPMPPVPLIGRDDEIAQLRDIKGMIRKEDSKKCQETPRPLPFRRFDRETNSALLSASCPKRSQ